MKGTLTAGALLLAGLLAGCGGDTTVVNQDSSPKVSQGQELTDLQRALDAGAINQKEYDKLKQVVLKRAP